MARETFHATPKKVWRSKNRRGGDVSPSYKALSYNHGAKFRRELDRTCAGLARKFMEVMFVPPSGK